MQVSIIHTKQKHQNIISQNTNFKTSDLDFKWREQNTKQYEIFQTINNTDLHEEHCNDKNSSSEPNQLKKNTWK